MLPAESVVVNTSFYVLFTFCHVSGRLAEENNKKGIEIKLAHSVILKKKRIEKRRELTNLISEVSV